MKKISLFIALITCALAIFAQSNFNEDGIRLYHTPSQEELDWAKSKGYDTIRMTPTSPPSGQIRPIAEWEPAEAVLIRYPLGFPVSFVQKLAEYIKVITVVTQSNLSAAQSSYTSGGVNMSNCEFLIANSNSYWTRDYGPWFMAIDNSRVSMFDFTYNRPRPQDNLVNGILASHLSMVNDYTYFVSPLDLTGGNYMNDGIKQAASSTVTLTENSWWGNEQQIRDHFHDYLGIEQYHFREDPVSTSSSYLQHIDCWAKFLGPDKILVDSVAPSNATYYPKFEAVANYFRSQISSYGTPFKVYRVFAPGAPSSSPLTPYTNSLILNNKVFVPTGGNTYDAAALQVYQQAMPGYTIVPVAQLASEPWLNTDALHCRTHEIADQCMLYVKHQPKSGEIANTGVVNFTAEIYSYCNNTIYPDSVIVYLKENGGAYQPYNMENTGGNTWEVNITGLPAGVVAYYIFAADASGRRECHPYIGGADPHRFTLTGDAPKLPAISLDKTNSSVTSEGNEVVKDYITISNIGEASLTFDVADIDFDKMLTIEPATGTVQAGDSQILTLSYDFKTLAKNKEFSGTFNLKSNDPLKPVISISLSASLIEVPVLSLDKTTSSVTSTGHEVMEDQITISNLGKADLTFEIIDLNFDKMLTVSPLNGIIGADSTQILTLSYDFSNVEKGDYLGSFKLLSNDPNHAETEISLFAYQTYNGISAPNMSAIYIYPNPATKSINIYFNNNNPAKAYIYNILGVQLQEKALANGTTAVDIKELPSGIYFIKIENCVYKFVKQ